MNIEKDYMGDGVYAEHDGFGSIYLEPEVFNALARYVERIKERPEERP